MQRQAHMMGWRQVMFALMASVIALTVARPAHPQAKPEEPDQVLKMSQVPQKVQQAIKAYASTAEIKKITKGDVDGTVAYEFQLEKAGRKLEVAITPDGRFLASEEEVMLSELPEAARQAVIAQAGSGRVVTVDKVVEQGQTVFEAVVEEHGKQREISVSPQGSVVGTQDDVALTDIPEPARTIMQARAAGGKLLSTKKSVEGGKTTFVAIIDKAGKQQQISVAPDGKILEVENIKL